MVSGIRTLAQNTISRGFLDWDSGVGEGRGHAVSGSSAARHRRSRSRLRHGGFTLLPNGQPFGTNWFIISLSADRPPEIGWTYSHTFPQLRWQRSRQETPPVGGSVPAAAAGPARACVLLSCFSRLRPRRRCESDLFLWIPVSLQHWHCLHSHRARASPSYFFLSLLCHPRLLLDCVLTASLGRQLRSGTPELPQSLGHPQPLCRSEVEHDRI